MSAEFVSDARLAQEVDWLSHSAAQRRARHDALRDIARDLPDPARYARYLPLEVVEALVGAWLSNNNDEWRVSREAAELLRPFGLVGYGTQGLTGFGIGVRKAILAGRD